MVFPLCTGGELYEHIISRGHFTENDAADVMRDLISGIHALHQHDILHLDIKPENLLFESAAANAKIKITDFGLSKVVLIYFFLFPFLRSSSPSLFHSFFSLSLSIFYLHKVFHDTENERQRDPTIEELEERTRAFVETGNLKRDKLRGTVGYMSPELILMGYQVCSSSVMSKVYSYNHIAI